VVSIFDHFLPEFEKEEASLFVRRDYGHPNAQGHSLTARVVAPVINELRGGDGR